MGVPELDDMLKAEGPTMERMPQSGLTTMREKLRSATSPQAAVSCSIGFIDRAKAG